MKPPRIASASSAISAGKSSVRSMSSAEKRRMVPRSPPRKRGLRPFERLGFEPPPVGLAPACARGAAVATLGHPCRGRARDHAEHGGDDRNGEERRLHREGGV